MCSMYTKSDLKRKASLEKGGTIDKEEQGQEGRNQKKNGRESRKIKKRTAKDETGKGKKKMNQRLIGRKMKTMKESKQ